MRGLDAYITGGRYSSVPVDVVCPCGHEFGASSCSEFGAGWYEPEECPKCGSSDYDDWRVTDAEPPEPERPDFPEENW